MVTKTDVSSPAAPAALCDLPGPLLVALLAGDERSVETLFETAASRGADLALISRDLVEPALDEVGQLWRAGGITVAEEHLATALVARAVTRQAAAVPCPPLGAPRLLLSCLAGEFHELGVRIISEVARAAGWQAEAFGANTPRESVLRFIAQRQPEAVGLSLALAAHMPECTRTVEEIRKVAPKTKVLVGGYALRYDRNLCGLTGADACFPDAVSLRDWLVAMRPCPGRTAPAPPACCTSGLPDALRRKITSGR